MTTPTPRIRSRTTGPGPKRNAIRSNANSAVNQPHRKRKILVTGYPGFIGKRLVKKLMQTEPNSDLYLLVQNKFADDAKGYVRAGNSNNNLDKVHIIVGDIANMHLGLSASEYRQLTRSLTDIYHLAAISYLGVPDSKMWQVNVQGTGNLLEIAEETPNLKRFNYISSCFVSGDREGVVSENELDCGQKFRNLYERTKFEAEKKVQAAMDHLPISIYRPSIVVGDSKTGEIGRFDGPYYLGILLVSSPVSVPLPLPENGNAPLNMIPVDYVVDSISYLSLHPDAVGKTFQLVDPNPKSAKVVYDLVAASAGIESKRKSRSASIPSFLGGLTKLILSIPGLEKVSRAPRQAIDLVNTITIYNSNNTLELLRGTDIQCPAFESYVGNLVDFVKAYYEERKLKRDVEEDPLA